MPRDNVINFRPALADLAAKRFGRALASIGLHDPTILQADFATFNDLPVEVFLGGDETTAMRLIGVSALLESGAVVHVFEDEGHEQVIVVVYLTTDGQEAVAMIPGDITWQSFLRLRSMSAAA